MTAIFLIFLAFLSWIGCGVIAAGIYYADFQRQYPTLALLERESDSRKAILFGIGGPCSLVVGLFSSNFMRHGWLLPGRNP